MPTPKVSVIVPSYNRADYIKETIDSILAQSYTDFELIFIDDGSTDNTEKIVNEYCDKDSRVKYFKQKNSERAVARSHGLRLALGDYLCLVDSDDTWYPEKLAKQVKVLDENPDVVLCYASVNRIDFSSNRVKASSRQHQGFSGDIFEELLKRNFIPSVTPMFRKAAFNKVGDQVTEFIPYEDWDFWLRLSKQGKFHHIKEALGDYRLHPGQSVQNVKAEKIEEVTFKVLDANTKETNESAKNEAYSLAFLRVAYWYIVAGKVSIGREKLRKSWANSSKRKLDYRFYGLYLISFLRPILGNLVTKFLGGFH